MKNHKKSRGQSFAAVLYALVFVAVGFFLAAAQQVQAAIITGTVRDATPALLAGQVVDIYDCTTSVPVNYNGLLYSGTTNGSGGYSITVSEGSYRIAVTSGSAYVDYWYKDLTTYVGAECVTVGAGGITLDDIVLTPVVNPGSISGTVTNAGTNGIQGVMVYVHSTSNSDVLTETTSAAGYYQITGLPSGTYKVEFFASSAGYINEWHYNQTTKALADLVTVNASTDTPVNAVLATGSSISGKVTVGSSTGPAVVNAWVDVCDSGSAVCNSSSATWRGYDQTDNTGFYEVKGLPTTPGTYIVQFHEKTVQNAGAGVTQFYNNQQTIGSATTVDINTNNTGINAVFAGATIQGTVTKNGGGGLAGVVVKLYNSTGTLLATSSATLDDGEYTFSGLATGSYKLYFNADATDYVGEWFDNVNTTIGDATSVDVASLSDTLTRDAELDKKANLAPVYELLLLKEKTP